MTDPDHLAARIASTQIADSNPQASWNWMETKLSDLTWIVKQSQLPLDWIQAEQLENPVCNELTEWLKENYDHLNARFHISLIAALVLTAWALSHQIKHNEGNIPSECKKGANMVEYAHSLVWDHEYWTTQSGWKAKVPLFHLWLIFISAIVVEESPWWQREEQKVQTQSIKKASHTPEQEENTNMMSAFHTKLHIPNAFKPGSCFLKDWKLHTKAMLEAGLATVYKHLAQPAHMCPVFCAVRHFLGDKCCRLHIGEKFQVPAFKMHVPSNSLRHKASEQSLCEDSESSNDDDENPGAWSYPCW
ncbi:uncharacterized protein EI90DRAFT_3021473 [Cantharellus anzutake]|uniref:uncharacterized protein n=1 Tax=Cantharellus anzutake TaxID=1750568 RepID=UPI001908F56C|nr:uncharacterized protein EI90DRAFT_3021473 [Cantharellus anzutake]KAF8316931.1 hypothetical protein EI90DRAFT_3021473 [Cantharellus anzutake]